MDQCLEAVKVVVSLCIILVPTTLNLFNTLLRILLKSPNTRTGVNGCCAINLVKCFKTLSEYGGGT